MDGSMWPGAATTRWFEDFHIGERLLLPERRLDAAMLDGFALASCGRMEAAAADFSPVAALLVLIQSAPGQCAALSGAPVLGLVWQSSRFVQAAQCGDWLVPVLQVVALEPGGSSGLVALRSTVHTDRRALLMEGEQHFLVRRRPGAVDHGWVRA